ncbi:lysophospholipid acyltransferase family protein [Actinocorallia herbida]|uniref:lysophospholipid acyltransferase family protein n=1 Tax=Actinocorallia herbida TaxID=58109 RepID=UPI001B861DD7|nr:lysophospholipid acyltransferase family protein [Actinocorallia herbida]
MTAALPAVPGRTAALRAARLATVLTRALPSAPDDLPSLSRALLQALDVTLDTGGPGEGLSVAGEAGTLVVANHVSWLDVPVLLALEPVTMLAKQEVEGWPVIGGLARRAGTRFIDRDGLWSLPGTVAELAGLLRAGTSVMAFPEGTTRCRVPGTLHRAVFQAALDAGAPIRPVTLTYRQGHSPSTLAAYVGTDPFTLSLRRVLSAADLTVHVRVHPPLHPSPSDTRRALALRAASLLSPDGPAPAHLVPVAG